MGARIIQLAEVRAKRFGIAAAPANRPLPRLIERFHFWRGASGKRYVHSVYALVECPEVDGCNYMLVRRDEAGRRRLLLIGRLSHDAASLNLAEIRQRGATLGANEVHVHLLATSEHDMKMVEVDLRTALALETPTTPDESCRPEITG